MFEEIRAVIENTLPLYPNARTVLLVNGAQWQDIVTKVNESDDYVLKEVVEGQFFEGLYKGEMGDAHRIESLLFIFPPDEIMFTVTLRPTEVMKYLDTLSNPKPLRSWEDPTLGSLLRGAYKYYPEFEMIVIVPEKEWLGIWARLLQKDELLLDQKGPYTWLLHDVKDGLDKQAEVAVFVIDPKNSVFDEVMYMDRNRYGIQFMFKENKAP